MHGCQPTQCGCYMLQFPSSMGWMSDREQMADYDLPASVAHALAVSNASTLAYVGHSQGTIIAFAALASQPALAAKVHLTSPMTA